MNESAYAAVRCPVHGRVVMDRAEYNRQMSRPDATWRCPRWETDPPGQCGRDAEFDDFFFENEGGGAPVASGAACNPSKHLVRASIDLGLAACIFSFGLANERHVTPDDVAYLPVELADLNDAVRGNRDGSVPVSWGDLRLLFAARLRKSLEILERT